MMELSTPMSSTGSVTEAAEFPQSEALHSIQQEYLEQWHLLENLHTDEVPEAQPEEQRESDTTGHSSMTNADEDHDPNSYHSKQQEDSDQWFVLGENAVGVGTEVQLEGGETLVNGGDPDAGEKQDGEKVQQMSPYTEQWYELEQLKASVRSLGQAAGLSQSPQPSPGGEEVVSSTMSSGSLSVEALDQAEMQESLLQGGASNAGGSLIGENSNEEEDREAEDSGTSSSMDEPVDEIRVANYRWFPLRPSAVGEDEENATQTPYPTNSVIHTSNTDIPQDDIPLPWPHDNTQPPPPERSQPDGRDGPDLKRPPWVTNATVTAQQHVTPYPQSHSVASSAVTSQDSGSDVSAQSQPQSHNVTALDIITRSVPPVQKGPSLINELKRGHAPHLNSDSDTESPVSKLLGPNFRAVQDVLDRLKKDKLSGSDNEEAERPAFNQPLLTEESLNSGASIDIPTTSSREYVPEWRAGRSHVGMGSTLSNAEVNHVWPDTEGQNIDALNSGAIIGIPTSSSREYVPEWSAGQSFSGIGSTHRNAEMSHVSLSFRPETLAVQNMDAFNSGGSIGIPTSNSKEYVPEWSAGRTLSGIGSMHSNAEMSHVLLSSRPDTLPSSNMDALNSGASIDIPTSSSREYAPEWSAGRSLSGIRSMPHNGEMSHVSLSSRPDMPPARNMDALYSGIPTSSSREYVPKWSKGHSLSGTESIQSNADRSHVSLHVSSRPDMLPAGNIMDALNSGAGNGIPISNSREYVPGRSAGVSLSGIGSTHNYADLSHVLSSSRSDVPPVRNMDAYNDSKHSQGPTPRSSLGSSVLSSRVAWGEPEQPSRNTSETPSYHDPNAEVGRTIPADNFIFPVRTSSALVEGSRSVFDGDSLRSNQPTALDKSSYSTRSALDHRKVVKNTSKSRHSSHHSRHSDRSASSDDTDDLLTYEPVFEGDRHYLQMQRKASKSGSRQPDVIENAGTNMSRNSARNVESNRGTIKHDKDQSSFKTQAQVMPQENTPLTLLGDSDIKSLHWSLGAGTVSPISAISLAQGDSQLEKEQSWSSLGEASRGQGSGSIQEQTLSSDHESVTSRDDDRNAAVPLGEQERQSATDVSSTSDELYRPTLRGDISEHKAALINGDVYNPVSYGIYDIRRSSGPGSTNRRRKAMGLQPNPAREVVSSEALGPVYISGSSTASSVKGRNGGGGGIGREEVVTRRTGHEVVQLGLEHSEVGPVGNVRAKDFEHTKHSTPLIGAHLRGGLEGVQFNGRLMVNGYFPTEDQTSLHSDRAPPHDLSIKDTPAANSAMEQLSHPMRASLASDKSQGQRGSRHLKDSSNGSGHSASHGRTRAKHPVESTLPSSQQGRVEKKGRSKKHHMGMHDVAKSQRVSHERSEPPRSKSTRLDSNISKLSSLISGLTDENISSSSQTSSVHTLRRGTSHGKKPKTSSSSESSDVSEHFNLAFVGPGLGTAVGQQIRLRELLKSFRSRSIPAIVRRRESTSGESTSCLSSSETAGDASPVEREQYPHGKSDREIHSAPPASRAPKCLCTCSQKAVVQKTVPVQTANMDSEKEFAMPPKRDVGVNFPTPAVARTQATSPDGTPRGQLEDASTQTEDRSLRGNLDSGHKENRKIDRELDKVQRDSVKIKRQLEERGVISQPSPKKSDRLSNMAVHSVVQHAPKERLIPSQNSPDHVRKKTSDHLNRNQFPVWFHPLSGKPQTETRAEAPQPSNRSHRNDKTRVNLFDNLYDTSNSLQKLTLQEAFLFAKPQFVRRSQERAARVEEAGRREKSKEPVITESAVEKDRTTGYKTKTPPEASKFRSQATSDHLHVPKPRQMTRAEMKDLNKRLYKNLPEVKAQSEQKKRQAFYCTNRLRAQLYNKRVRNRLKGAGK